MVLVARESETSYPGNKYINVTDSWKPVKNARGLGPSVVVAVCERDPFLLTFQKRNIAAGFEIS